MFSKASHGFHRGVPYGGGTRFLFVCSLCKPIHSWRCASASYGVGRCLRPSGRGFSDRVKTITTSIYRARYNYTSKAVVAYVAYEASDASRAFVSAWLLEPPQLMSKPGPGPQLARTGRSSLPRTRSRLEIPARASPSAAECSTRAARGCACAAECRHGAARESPKSARSVASVRVPGAKPE